MIKGSIHQKDITTVNKYAHNIRAPNYIKQILIELKGAIENNTIIVGDFQTQVSTMHRSSRQKINKGTLDLNYILYQVDLTYTEHSVQQQQSTHSSQGHMEHFSGQIVC